MAQPRLFLFHGTDSAASRAALKVWEDAFNKRHGEATRYVIEADDQGATDLQQLLVSYLQGRSLFSLPTFIVIKRLTRLDKPPGKAGSKAFLEVVERYRSLIDEQITLALWEDRALAADSLMVKAFGGWEKEGKAKIRHYSLPAESAISRRIASYFTERSQRIEPDALQWLAARYRELGKRARLAKRLKASEELLEDDRGWWLAQSMETASLKAGSSPVTISMLEAVVLPDPPGVSVFEIVNALSAGSFEKVRSLLSSLEEDESFYFSLIAALRWQLTRSPGALASRREHIIQLLVGCELIVKNFPLPLAWLVDLLIERIEASVVRGEKEAILPARQLWLAHLARS